MSVYDEDRCASLRWKGLFIHTPGVSDDGQDHVYWCHKTLNCLGPDGKVVDDYECNESRGCYQSI